MQLIKEVKCNPNYKKCAAPKKAIVKKDEVAAKKRALFI